MRGDLLQVRLIDSDLRFFKISDARVVGRAGVFGWRPGFEGTYLKVEPVLELARQLSLDEAQRYVIDFVKSHTDVYEGEIVAREVVAAVQAAMSPQELITAAG